MLSKPIILILLSPPSPLPQIKNHSALHTLDLSYNSIGFTGASAIASALDCRWPLVKSLDKLILNINNVTARGAVVLCEVGQGGIALH